MTQATNIIALAQAIGADIGTLTTNQGVLTNLTTTAKNNLVAALNEVRGMVTSIDTGSVIDDTSPSTSTTYSSSMLETKVEEAIAALVDGAPEAFDTLKELADYVASDQTAMSALTASLNKRVRFDQSQTMTAAEKLTVCTNIGVGDPTTDFAAAYSTAKV